MTKATNILPSDADREIVTARTFNAPRQLVYKAWTDPAHLKVWWGPNGFTNTFNEFDFRVGGRWKFVMHGPDKGNYVNEVTFKVIREPELIIWDRHQNHCSRLKLLLKRYPTTKPESYSSKSFRPLKNVRNSENMFLKRMKKTWTGLRKN